MPDRCEVTELLTAECAHCRRIPDVRPPERRGRVMISAGYAGKCADCGDWYPTGAMIIATPDGWVADCCTEGGPDG
jgi:hypothetical protein